MAVRPVFSSVGFSQAAAPGSRAREQSRGFSSAPQPGDAISEPPRRSPALAPWHRPRPRGPGAAAARGGGRDGELRVPASSHPRPIHLGDHRSWSRIVERRGRTRLSACCRVEPASQPPGGLRRKWCSSEMADPSWTEQTECWSAGVQVAGEGGGLRRRRRSRCFPGYLQHPGSTFPGLHGSPMK